MEEVKEALLLRLGGAAKKHIARQLRVLVPDNTKALVVTADALGARVTPAFLEYAQARGFHVDAARARSPQDKGRVERSVPTVRDDCFGGERLRSLEQACERSRRWCLEEYGMRRQAGQGRALGPTHRATRPHASRLTSRPPSLVLMRSNGGGDRGLHEPP
ncbi:transposase family protein [Myxococcus eversor]|uniref:transposase family protein n=1 Tax=Myxococcus eversor TaxID=2709661 RepID=UPI0013D0C047|nr:transposase family protein [Myxococcus eversor]